MVPLCLPFCNIFLKCNLLPEFMEHFFFLHAFNLFQNVSLKFLCKVHSTLCEESGRQRSLVGTECIIPWRGLRFKPLLSVMLSLARRGRDSLCWSLGRLPLCGLEGHPWQAHGERERGGRRGQRFAFRAWQRHWEVARVSWVRGQERRRPHWQSFLQTSQEGTLVMFIINYLLVICGSLHFQSLTVTLKIYSLLSNVKATKHQTSI